MTAGTLLAIVWTVGAVAMFRRVFRLLMDGLCIGDDFDAGWVDVLMGTLIAVIATAVMWPAFLAGMVLQRLVAAKDPAAFMRVVAGESRRDKAKRMEREAQDRELHIARLERQLRVGDES